MLSQSNSLHHQTSSEMTMMMMNHQQQEYQEEEELVVPYGHRFKPTDQELLGFWLRRKVNGEVLPKPNVIVDVGNNLLYGTNQPSPWELFNIRSDGDGAATAMKKKQELYFFTLIPKGKRIPRTVSTGTWKNNSNDKVYHHLTKEVIGMKKVFSFIDKKKETKEDDCSKKKKKKHEQPSLVMHEYSLNAYPKKAAQGGGDQHIWIVCRLKYKPGKEPPRKRPPAPLRHCEPAQKRTKPSPSILSETLAPQFVVENTSTSTCCDDDNFHVVYPPLLQQQEEECGATVGACDFIVIDDSSMEGFPANLQGELIHDTMYDFTAQTESEPTTNSCNEEEDDDMENFTAQLEGELAANCNEGLASEPKTSCAADNDATTSSPPSSSKQSACHDDSSQQQPESEIQTEELTYDKPYDYLDDDKFARELAYFVGEPLQEEDIASFDFGNLMGVDLLYEHI